MRRPTPIVRGPNRPSSAIEPSKHAWRKSGNGLPPRTNTVSAVAPKNRHLVDASLRRDHNRFLLRQCINANGHCFGASVPPLPCLLEYEPQASLRPIKEIESPRSITIPTAACDMRRLLLNTARRDSNIHATRAEVPARPNCGDRRNASRSAVRWRTRCAITHTAFRIRTRDARRMKGCATARACLRCCGR